jgi:trehalose utilization protein
MVTGHLVIKIHATDRWCIIDSIVGTNCSHLHIEHVKKERIVVVTLTRGSPINLGLYTERLVAELQIYLGLMD